MLKGFGYLYPSDKNRRQARNPKTRVVVYILKRLSLKLSFSKFLFEDLNK